jgi:predicted RNA-binding Zn-ribbon protein involved in translation (DUF1610 family)
MEEKEKSLNYHEPFVAEFIDTHKCPNNKNKLVYDEIKYEFKCPKCGYIIWNVQAI